MPHPATVRPQGLATLSAVYALRARAGLVSYRRRSWEFALRSFLLPEGTDRVSAGVNPPTVSPVGSPALLRWAGPTGRGSWAFTLPGVPGDRHRISAASAGCSLGLCPLRAWGSKRRTGFRPRSSLALERAVLRPDRRRLGVLNNLDLRLFPQPENRQLDEATLSGFAHRIARKRSDEGRPGY